MPTNTSFFNDLLSTIADRGWSLLDRRRGRTDGPQDVVGQCEDLLSSRGEASGVALAREILETYARLDPAKKKLFFEALLERFGPDQALIETAIETFASAGDAAAAAALNDATEARRQELIRRLNLAPGGTAALVAMRAELLECVRADPRLKVVDRDFAHLFASWFNRGFLMLRRIDWSTPASILEKIIRYEAVHEISDWDDLRRRIDPPDRRCFAFFHPSLADDPLIFVEVALTAAMPTAIAPILSGDRPALAPADATTAVFYSISNCQAGLRGVSFGNFLIKHVAEELAREFPALKTFVTLSPIPGLRAWLADLAGEGVASVALSSEQRKALSLLDYEGWSRRDAASRHVESVLMPLAAHYLANAKSPLGRPLDAVARFHLGNGARLERLNWQADTSAKGIAESAGVMVNYQYVLKDVERNHEAFAATGEIAMSAGVRNLLRAGRPPALETPAGDLHEAG